MRVTYSNGFNNGIYWGEHTSFWKDFIVGWGLYDYFTHFYFATVLLHEALPTEELFVAKEVCFYFDLSTFYNRIA